MVRSDGLKNTSPRILPASARRSGVSCSRPASASRSMISARSKSARSRKRFMRPDSRSDGGERFAQPIDVTFVEDVCGQQSQYLRIAAGAGEDAFLEQRRVHLLGGAGGLEAEQETRSLHPGDGSNQAMGANVRRYLTHVGK